MKIFKLGGRRLGAAAAAALAAGVLATGALSGTAHADTLSVTRGTVPFYLVTAGPQWFLGVSDASTAVGAPVVDWAEDRSSDQMWYIDFVYSDGHVIGYMLRNANSGLCMTTDNTQGDTIYQADCTLDGLDILTETPATGTTSYFQFLGWPNLTLDVFGASTQEGAVIDGWSFNGNQNQQFLVAPVSANP